MRIDTTVKHLISRRDGTGPVHARWMGVQAWCGARARRTQRITEGTQSDVTCPHCITRLKRQRPAPVGTY